MPENLLRGGEQSFRIGPFDPRRDTQETIRISRRIRYESLDLQGCPPPLPLSRAPLGVVSSSIETVTALREIAPPDAERPACAVDRRDHLLEDVHGAPRNKWTRVTSFTFSRKIFMTDLARHFTCVPQQC
jgi:hypothetical protein